ncbi:hypothetical protein KUCAC02_028208, partial [Chaenocephalus aceratus]
RRSSPGEERFPSPSISEPEEREGPQGPHLRPRPHARSSHNPLALLKAALHRNHLCQHKLLFPQIAPED